MPRRSSSDPHLDHADARETRPCTVAWSERERAHQRAGHHRLARPQAASVFAELAREPGDRVQRVVEHRGADTSRDDTSVQLDSGFHLIEPQPRRKLDRLAENDRALLRIVGQHQRNLPGVAARLGDLEGGMNNGHRLPHLLERHHAREWSTQAHAKLGFEAGPDQLAGREHMAARPRLQNAAEGGLVKAELLLDRFGGQTDLPADLPFACRTTAIDQGQLDAVRLVQTQPIEIAGRKVVAAAAPGPEILYRALEIDCHDRCPKNGEPVVSVYTGMVRIWWARPIIAVSSR